MAETLALLGARPGRLTAAGEVHHLPDRVVRKLLEGQDWLRWASLSPQLPILAEAAPVQFLEQVRSAEAALLRLFQAEGDPLFSSNPHTGLLWRSKCWHGTVSRCQK